MWWNTVGNMNWELISLEENFYDMGVALIGKKNVFVGWKIYNL